MSDNPTLRFPSLLGSLDVEEPSPAAERAHTLTRPTTKSRAAAPRPAAGRRAVSAPRASCREGAMFGDKWRIVRRIGVGGSAEIFEAEHRNGRRGALKVLRAGLVEDSDARERFMREGIIANEIRHPGIVQALDDDVLPDGTPYLVLELLEGQPLDAHTQAAGGRLPAREVAHLGVQLADILAAVHRARIVHRDIKPENLFLGSDGTLKLLDFGTAKFRARPSKTRTYAGIAMGTPGYLPAEQAWGRWDAVDARSDLWAAGAVLFRLLTGSFVQPGESMTRRLLVAMSDAPKRIEDVAPDAPKVLAQVIDKALEVDPDKRFQTAEQMRAALEAALTALDSPVAIAPVAAKPYAPPVERLDTIGPALRVKPRYGALVSGFAVAAVAICAVVAGCWAVDASLVQLSTRDSPETWSSSAAGMPVGLLCASPPR